MFRKILIANRGEIAVRIMATCRDMGIQTVSVYSEADQHAQHVYEADEAYDVGPAPATQSYLRIDAIIAIAKKSGAEAIHPGYGFLSENASFAEACEEAGIVFIGPSAAAMRLMGSKIAAKQLAQSVGIPTVPGYNGTSQSNATLMSEAQRIGFPLLIKASAGGGGKGMRSVYSAEDFLEQLAGARREALAAFGDETVFLERFIQEPRHVEIQILGDQYGHMIHLGERECSIQRRHQKILEESPSVVLTPELREEMGTAAVRIARAAGYVNAGTTEFLLDADKHFYFLEMNTRLQVEHPVTEMVTGLDLVRHQLRIAAGEPLDIAQEQVSQRGHAIEVRLYAENPEQNFLPSTGTITRFIKAEGPGIRIDSGIIDGDEITQYYDPMIAKLIVSGEDRDAAIDRLQQALQHCAVFGVSTNISLLHTISAHPIFRQGHTYTDFLEKHALLGASAPQEVPDDALIAAALYEMQPEIQPQNAIQPSSNGNNPWQRLGPWRMVGEARIITYRYQGQSYKVSIRPSTSTMSAWHVQINMQTSEDIACTIDNGILVLLRTGEQQRRLYVQQSKREMQVMLKGQVYLLQRQQPPDIATTMRGGGIAQAQKTLTAPMAGTIVKVQVQDGEAVQAHQVLVILSAMKMEHIITAPYEGTVHRVHYQEGAVVAGGVIIIEME
jgi:3-methylcrotonyl-CoA carboxylase alpha subunit